MDFKRIGRNIDEIRRARNWTKTELAERVGTTESQVSDHTNKGKMSLEYLFRYAEALGCSAGELLDGAADITKFSLEADIFSYYPYNLIAYMFCGDRYLKDEEAKKDVADTVYSFYIPGFLDSLNSLKERDRKVLEYRFKHGMTLEEVGKIYGVTRDRIRQIEAKTIRRLRNPQFWKKWKMDTMHMALDIAKERDALRLENICLKEKLSKIANVMDMKPEEIETRFSTEEKEVSVEDLELSVRSYNCLKRAGVNFVSDMKEWTLDDLMNVRNLGRRSADEIMTALLSHGIDIRHNLPKS